jgi:hypothetical protein
MKRNFILLLVFWMQTAFAVDVFSNCSQALPTNDPNFCPSFQSIAECHCIEMGVPKGMCKDMHTIYNRMIAMFGSVQRACEYQHDASVQTCVDDWNCYRNGGTDSEGRLCSGTGGSCNWLKSA